MEFGEYDKRKIVSFEWMEKNSYRITSLFVATKQDIN